MGRFSVNARRIAAIVAFGACWYQTSGKCLAESGTDPQSYSAGVRIAAGDAETALIRTHLDSLAKFPTGKKLLEAIAAAAAKSGKSVTITYAKGDAWTALASNDGYPVRTTREGDVVTVVEPGAGSSATIGYDPRWEDTNEGDTMPGGIDCLTPEVILGHELIHALHALQGRILSQTPYVEPNGTAINYEERVTSGFGGVSDPDGITENAIRREQKIGDRTTYARLCEVASVTPKSKGFVKALTREPHPGVVRPRDAGQPNARRGNEHPTGQAQPGRRTTRADRQQLLAATLNSALGE